MNHTTKWMKVPNLLHGMPNSSANFSGDMGNPALIKMLVDTAQASRWMLAFSIALGIAGNLTTVIVYLKQKCLPVYKKLILHLAICDLIYCFAMIMTVHRRFRNHVWIFGPVFCKLTIIAPTSLSCSMFTVTVIAIERYRTIMSSFRPKWKNSTLYALILILWIISILMYIPYFLKKGIVSQYDKEDCLTSWKEDQKEFKKYYDLAVFVLTYPVPLLIIAFCYARIGYSALKGFVFRNMDNSCKVVNSNHKSRQGGNFRVYRKLIFMLLLVLCTFIVTTTPNHALILWLNFVPQNHGSIDDKRKTFIVLLIFSSLVYLHVWINPIIYTLADKRNRRVLHSMLCNVFTKCKRGDGKDFNQNRRHSEEKNLFIRGKLRRKSKPNYVYQQETQYGGKCEKDADSSKGRAKKVSSNMSHKISTVAETRV